MRCGTVGQNRDRFTFDSWNAWNSMVCFECCVLYITMLWDVVSVREWMMMLVLTGNMPFLVFMSVCLFVCLLC